MRKLVLSALLFACFTTNALAFQVSDLAEYQSVAIKQMHKTDTKANKNRQIMGTQAIMVTLGTQDGNYKTKYVYVGKNIPEHTGKTNWHYFCPPSWHGRCKGHINYAANEIMDAAKVGDLLVLGKRSDDMLDIIIVQQDNAMIAEIYGFMGVSGFDTTSSSSSAETSKAKSSFWSWLIGDRTQTTIKEKTEQEEPVPDLSDVDWSRIDLDIYKNNQTGQIFFEGYPTRIIDGDTIVLAEVIKVRMEGMDAPESRQNCLDSRGREYACGQKATEHLRKIIGKAKLRCEMNGFGAYGRFLMICRKLDGFDIHAQMVRDGYAVVSTYTPDLYIAEENYAIEHKLGIHKGKFQHPHCWRYKKKQNWKVPGLCENGTHYSGWAKLQ